MEETSLYFGYFFSAVVVLIMGSLFMLAVQVEDKSYLAKLYFLFLVLGIILVPIIHYWLMTAGYDGYIFGDDESYHNKSWSVARAWMRGNTSVGFGSENDGYFKFIAYLYMVTGPNTLIARLANIFFSSVCIVYMYKLARLYFNRAIAKRSALIVALLPTFMFWSISQFKEPLIILTTLLTVYLGSYFLIHKKLSLWQILWLSASVAVLYSLRHSVAYLLVLIIFSTYFLSTTKELSLVKLIAGLLVFFVLLAGARRLTQRDFVDMTEDLEEKLDRVAEARLTGGGDASTEQIITFVKINSLREFYKLPFGTIAVLLLPYPPIPKLLQEKVRLPSKMFVAVTFVHVCLLGYICFGWFYLLRHETRRSFLLYFIPLVFIAGIAYSHPGVLRYRDQWIPFFAVLAAVGMEHKKKAKNFIFFFNLIFIFILPVCYLIIKARSG